MFLVSATLAINNKFISGLSFLNFRWNDLLAAIYFYGLQSICSIVSKLCLRAYLKKIYLVSNIFLNHSIIYHLIIIKWIFYSGGISETDVPREIDYDDSRNSKKTTLMVKEMTVFLQFLLFEIIFRDFSQ